MGGIREGAVFVPRCAGGYQKGVGTSAPPSFRSLTALASPQPRFWSGRRTWPVVPSLIWYMRVDAGKLRYPEFSPRWPNLRPSAQGASRDNFTQT